MLNGFPSIVIGIFVFTIIVKAPLPVLGWGHHQSAIAGGFALSIIMLPLVARSTMEVLRLVPNHLREASYALGRLQVADRHQRVLPTCFGGILTGTTLAIARAAGETAPLLFTCAIAGQIVDWNPAHSVQSMPLTIFQYSESADPNLHAAGLGDGVRPDHVRARHEPHRAPAARALPPQARPDALAPFTTPSPGRHTASAHVAAGAGQAGAVKHIAPPGTKERTSMKRGLALIGARRRRAPHGRGRRREDRNDTTITGAGSTFVQPLVSAWTPALGSAFGYTVQYSGVGSGAGIAAITNKQVDFGASDAPLTPDQATACGDCVQIPWALVGDGDRLQRSRRSRARESRRSDDLEDLPRPDHELERPGDRRAEQGREPART